MVELMVELTVENNELNRSGNAGVATIEVMYNALLNVVGGM